ncbi:alpha-aminoadipic semialdehyde synthase, mitochondrial-like isoform X1 [Styela clava]
MNRVSFGTATINKLCRNVSAVHLTKTLKSTSSAVLAVRREDNVVWERRAPLAPSHIRKLVKKGVKVIVQPANKRAYPVQEYEEEGAVIQEDISEASVVLGVKQVPDKCLHPEKTYVFFSHTIKAQRENMPMLDIILDRKIRLIDYEKMEIKPGMRVVAFGRYAGYAGMIDILHGMGLRLLALGHHTPFMHIGIAHNYRTSGQAIQAVRDAGYEISLGRMPQSIGPITFVFTGIGNVSQGAQEVFRELPHLYIEPHELKNVAEHGDSSRVYGCVIDMQHYLRRRIDGGFDMQEYFDHPEKYESTFAQEIAPYASCIVNGIFWRPRDPRLLTNEHAVSLQDPKFAPKISPIIRNAVTSSEGCPRLPHRLIAIADISADPEGSIEFMTECTSIDAPFTMYNAVNESVIPGVKDEGVLLCSIDNLPAQLPREATNFFGDQLMPYMHDIISNDAKVPYEDIKDMSPVVKNAIIASNGKLTPQYEYIHQLRQQSIIEMNRSQVIKRVQTGAMSISDGKKYKVLVLGAGFVSRPVLEYLTRRNDTAVTVASNKQSEIADLSGKYGDTNPILMNAGEEKARLVDLIRGHDLVISLLPYTMHAPVAETCIEQKKNLVTASYVSEQIKALHNRAVDAGVTIGMEFGLDPGIDHMLAMQCFDEIKRKGGEISSFISWCGGLPAPEDSNNPLRYKFSWSPQGVLMVTLAPAKYLYNGELIERSEGGENYRKPPHEIHGFPGFNLEGIPNRDSIKYAKEYGIESVDTILRGTLRYKGFADAVVGLQQLGLIDMTQNDYLQPDSSDITWKQLIPKLLNDQREEISDEELQAMVYDQVDQEVTRLKAINQLGLMTDEPVAKAGTPMSALAEHLSRKLAYGPDERDMVIMRHEVVGKYSDRTKQHNVNLVMYGQPGHHTAMAAGVGYPCAILARMILQGKVDDKGIVTPLRSQIYEKVLSKLRELGIKAKSEVITQKFN